MESDNKSLENKLKEPNDKRVLLMPAPKGYSGIEVLGMMSFELAANPLYPDLFPGEQIDEVHTPRCDKPEDILNDNYHRE